MYDNFDPLALGKLYYDFHRAMLQTIQNKFLKEITDTLYHRTSRVWLQLLPDLDWAEEVELMCDEIERVTKALSSEDMLEVAKIRHEHMAMLLKRINNYLGDV
jgi:DNA-binding GntR family transcriptional regulator